MKWRLLICSLALIVFTLILHADVLIVAGQTQHLSSPLQVEQNEVLAPLVPSLRLLGVKVTTNGSAITLTTPQHSIKLTTGAKTALVDKEKVTLSSAPCEQNHVLYLPAKAVARLLGAEARFDEPTRTLTVVPLLTVQHELRPEGLAVMVRSALPLQFTSGEMSGPPRAFFDFKNASLGLAEQQLPVDAGRVDRVRISQFSMTPPTVRLVCDFSEAASTKTVVGEQGCLITILVGEKVVKPQAPVIPETPVVPAAPTVVPITLQHAELRDHSATQSEFLLAATGVPDVTTAYDQKTRQLQLTVRNGMNAVSPRDLQQLHNRLVSAVRASGEADTPGSQFTLTLKQDAGYLVQEEPTGLRVLIGSFDISDMVVVLDAGHGGDDVGAVGVNRTFEKNVNLDVVLRAADLLRNAGATVLLTRSDDTFIPLNDRPALANTRKADVFIAVHCNSMPKPNTASGSQTYYYTPQSSTLAAAVHEELVKSLGLKNGGVRTAGYLVIRKSQMPSILLELAFINNTSEEALLSSPDFRQKAAQAILNGVRRYAATKDWQLRKGKVVEEDEE